MTQLPEEISAASGRRQVRFAFAATIGSMLLGGLLGALLMISLTDPVSPDMDLPRWGILVSEAFILVPLIILVKRRGLPLASSFRTAAVLPRTLLDAVFIGLGATILMDELDRMVALVFPLPENFSQAMGFLTFSNLPEALLVLGGAVVMAPLVEELVFRGFFQKQLEEGYQDATKAVLFSAALFMILHFNPWWSLQIYILGMILGYMAWRTGSIWPSVIVHGINNALAITLSNFPETALDWYVWGDHVGPQWLVLGLTFLVIGFKNFLRHNPEPLLMIKEA